MAIGKKAQKGGNVLLIVVVAVAAYLLIFGVPGQQTETTTTTTTEGSTGGCAVEDISFTPKMNQMGLLGTTVTDTNYFIVTDNIGAVAAGAAITVATNKDLEVYFGENSTSYYTVVENFNTDCSDPLTYSVELAKADKSLRINLFTDTGDNNDATDTQDMGAEDVVEMQLCVKTSADEYYGNPACDNNIVVIEYDKTYIRDVTGSEGNADKPDFFSATNTSNDGSTALVFPLIGENEEQCIFVSFEATSSDPTSAIAKPIIHFYDCDIDKNEDNLNVIKGFEDEDNNAISLAPQTRLVYLS
jgi:hypothetical protein